MRKASVDSLIAKAEQQLATVKSEYQASLQKQVIDTNLKIEIKNLCENLRSTLDYIAHDVREKYCPATNTKDRFYFPILPDAKAFTGTAGAWFPDLSKNSPQVWTLLESVQPYNSGFDWLSRFNKLNNENKHGDLVEQTRKEIHRVDVKIHGGGAVSWNPSAVKFGSGVFIGGVPVNPATQMPVPHPSQTVERTIWVDFHFQGIDVSAIQLLNQSVAGIKDIAARLYSVL